MNFYQRLDMVVLLLVVLRLGVCSCFRLRSSMHACVRVCVRACVRACMLVYINEKERDSERDIYIYI